MNMVSRIVGISVLAVCVSSNAYDVGQHNSKRDVTTKPVKKKVLLAPKYSPTQVLCLKQRRTGSRLTENKCQTLAQWKQELDEKSMRKFMVRQTGRRGWDTSP